MNYAVIMAGGAGTRFWPQSTLEHPKQFLNLFGEHTMIQETVNRLQPFIPANQLLVVTNKDYQPLVKGQIEGITDQQIIGEPMARNTAPCVASAAALLHRKDPDSVMIVLPADHRIEDAEEFIKVLKNAVSLAREKESLVTIGIKPEHPETGYGYIQYDKDHSLQAIDKTAYPVQNFTEKPNLETAEQFLRSGDYVWNSGMFIWKTSAILKAFEQHLPEMYKLTEKLINTDAKAEDINRFYQACSSISIDYGIMEKAENVHVIPASFGWNDVGNWRAVHELSARDKNNNVSESSPAIFLDSANNLVHSKSGKQVVLIGMENIALVETEKAIMVLNMDNHQDVKKVVEQLKSDPDRQDLI